MKRKVMLIALAVGLAAPLAMADVEFLNVALDDDYAAPGAWVLAQVIEFEPDSDITIQTVSVTNTAPEPKLELSDVEQIIVVRDSKYGPVVGSISDPVPSNGFVEIPAEPPHSEFAEDESHALFIYLLLSNDAPLGDKFALGGTKVHTNPEDPVNYDGDEATVLTVQEGPTVRSGDPKVENMTVYRGQTFIAQRITVDGTDVPFGFALDELLIRNDAAASPLTGAYIEEIEIRRAKDGAVMGRQTSSTELAKLTNAGTPVNLTSHNSIPAYEELVFEVWVTLAGNAPKGHKLAPEVTVWTESAGFTVDENIPEFTVGDPAGLEVNNDPLDFDALNVFSTERFLAQRIRVTDETVGPYDVAIDSVYVKNIAADRLAEHKIDRIEVRRARDNALMGEITEDDDISGFNVGGVRIITDQNNTVADATTEYLEIWITLKDHVPHNRKIRLQSTVWHTEGGNTFASAPVDGNATFTTGPEEDEGGFEVAETVELADRTVYQGQEFLAQRIKLTDNDANPYDVYITSLIIRNTADASPLSDHNVTHIEIRRRTDGAVLGGTSDTRGLRTEGVRIGTGENNRVPDDTSVELEIWLTLRQAIPTGRKVELETVVWHREGQQSFRTDSLEGPATFTTDLGDPPENVDFTWSPEEPEVGQPVTFTPDEDITDPEGDIDEAQFHWDFGDGEETTTTGPQEVQHTYTAADTYEVTLTVTGDIGISAQRSHDVTVIAMDLTVDFSWTPEQPVAGEEITFTAEVNNDPTEPITYAWDFGDETEVQETQEPTIPYTYNQPGEYQVTLEVTDDEGLTGTVTQTVTVGEAQVPELGAISVDPAVPEVTEDVTFTVPTEVPEGAEPATEWEWKFGDGNEATTNENTASHTYQAAGQYTVEVRARNEAGWSQTRTKDIYVREPGAALINTRLTENPVDTQATIQVFAPEGATELRLYIFDLMGRQVHEAAVDGDEAVWDLTDTRDRWVSSGVYLYLITGVFEETAIRSETGRIMVVR